MLRVLVFLLAWSSLGATPLALWVWEAETTRLRTDPPYAALVLARLQAEGATTLYLYADDYRGQNLLLQEGSSYRALVRRLHEAGLRVEALLGSHPLQAWECVPPEQDLAARNLMQHVLSYNAAALAVESFDGVHLDIEPQALDSWNADTREALCRWYLDRARMWVAMARRAGRGFKIGAAIPFWWDGFEVAWDGARKAMSTHVQEVFDYVAVMDYRNRADGPDGILALAAQEVAFAAGRGKQVVIGLEVGEAELPKMTFRDLGPKVLRQEMAKTAQVLGPKPSFAGFAIHHLRTWLEWFDRPTPPPASPGS